ncbi:MAG: sulfotransferase family 2 domain-containing protein [Thiothrix sp.]|nr:sulfotransferase family 2 domain-containing protein [Thiothrix sp.]HPE59381.1 sulfotransferase family 2 domain-containing protein [Thiolinea sp.]
MLLSHRYNFLFVHIAKTGGTSVRAALSPLRWRDPMYYLMWPCHRLSGLTGHRLGTRFPRHAHIIAAREMLPEPFFQGLFKFAFVRNPWDLQVSSFHHIRRERPEYLNGISDFNTFMRWKFNPERPYQYHIDTSLSLQSDYLIDLHGRLLTDFIGHYESLAADFAEVCTRIGIPVRALPHKREARDRARDYRSYYADDVAEQVAQHFRRDIEMLGYRF